MAKQRTPQQERDRSEYINELRNQTAAVRFEVERFGTRRALTADQLREAASRFGAEQDAISASKKIIDTRDEAYRKVSGLIGEAKSYWKTVTIPYPEKGIRLIRRAKIDELNEQLTLIRNHLRAACRELQTQYAMLRVHAQERLGTLFNSSDYPASIEDEFSFSWSFPTIDPPAYLRDLNPELYAQEAARVEARFHEAIALTETAFAQQLQRLVVHLADRLDGGVDGKPKVFRDSAVENIREFFGHFRELDLGSSVQLRQLVEQAEGVLAGVTPDDLRSVDDTRQRIANELNSIGDRLNTLMVDRPKRSIEFDDDEQGEAA